MKKNDELYLNSIVSDLKLQIREKEDQIKQLERQLQEKQTEHDHALE